MRRRLAAAAQADMFAFMNLLSEKTHSIYREHILQTFLERIHSMDRCAYLYLNKKAWVCLPMVAARVRGS